MRLNLGEIASSIGCRSDRVIWQPGLAGDAPSGRFSEEPQGILSLRDLTDLRSHGSWDGNFESQPWALTMPTGAQFDSREVQSGNLFFCLPGERTDGHEFGLEAAFAGASAIIASRNPYFGREDEVRYAQTGLPPVFIVEDVQKTLWRVATCHRDTSVARVIGVTGSAGKTSVKEVLAQVMAVRGFTQCSRKNFNNQLGLPICMLNAHADASFWVMEAGISQSHDMEELGSILQPDVALILNVGQAHVAGLSEKGVAANKAVLLDYVQPAGVAVVSADYPDLNAEIDRRMSDLERRSIQLVRFSARDADVAFRARYIGSGYDLMGKYEVTMQGGTIVVEAPFRGDYGSENVAAICAVAHTLGLRHEEILRGLACSVCPEQRFSGSREGACILIDDSYNANPLSMSRMLDAAATLAREKDMPLLLVLGEMLELGDESGDAHRSVGLAAAAVAPSVVFWKGGQGEQVRLGLGEGGYTGPFYPVSGGQDFSLLLEEIRPESGVILFKGSRGNHLERLVEVFREYILSAGDSHAV